MVPEKDNLKRD